MDLIHQWATALAAQLEWARAKSFKGALVHLAMAQDQITAALQNKLSDDDLSANLRYSKRQLFAAFAVLVRLVDGASQREVDFYERYFSPHMDDFEQARQRAAVELRHSLSKEA